MNVFQNAFLDHNILSISSVANRLTCPLSALSLDYWPKYCLEIWSLNDLEQISFESETTKSRSFKSGASEFDSKRFFNVKIFDQKACD